MSKKKKKLTTDPLECTRMLLSNGSNFNIFLGEHPPRPPYMLGPPNLYFLDPPLHSICRYHLATLRPEFYYECDWNCARIDVIVQQTLSGK